MSQRKGRGPARQPQNPSIRKITTKFLLEFYDACLRQENLTAIASSLNLTLQALHKYLNKFPELKEAQELAEKRKDKSGSIKDYIFQHLSSEAKFIWEQISFWQESKSSEIHFQRIISKKPKRLKQEIFIHALMANLWNRSKACRVACVSLTTVRDWELQDPEFQKLIHEVEIHRKNFIEEKLHMLVDQGNPGIVAYANRVMNADRGYNDRLTVEHKHSGEIHHVGYRASDLNLSLETRKEILDAIRVKKVIDAEIVEDPSPKQI